MTFSLPDGPDEMAIDPDTGVLTWTPAAGDLGDHSVSVRVADGRGGEDTQSFLLPVASAGSVINQPPTIGSSLRTSVGLEMLYTYFVQASDPNHDPLTFRLDESPPGMDIDQAGVVSWTPAADQLGDHPVTVRVEDGRGGFATQSFAIGVAQQTTNSPPTITSVPPFTAQVDQSYEYNAVAVDPDNDPVVWSLLSAPDGVSIDALRGALRWTPSNAQIGFHEVIVQATDTQGASGIQGFGLNVSGTNSPPVVTSAPPTLAFAGDPYF